MENAIANRQTASPEEIELSKKMMTVDEARRRIIEGGGFFIFQSVIDIPTFRDDLVSFARNYTPSTLDYAALLKWLRDNRLEKRLKGGSLEKQIKAQEEFYRKFYGKDFCIDRSRIAVSAARLPAIKKALETGAVNYVLVKATPKIIAKDEQYWTGAEYAFHKLLKPTGIKIWAETGTDRWTNLTLTEFLQRCNSAEPEEFNPDAFKKDWKKEETRILDQKGPVPKVQPGAVELVFTSDLPDIPRDQRIVNKDGEIVMPEGRSYIAAIANKVRVLSHEEGIILASQLYAKDKTRRARNIWEWRRDLIDHRDKNTNPPISVAGADSYFVELRLNSGDAGSSDDDGRFRLAL